MAIEQDYVLKRLDEWYDTLFEIKYTPQVAGELEERISKRLEGTKTLEMAIERNTLSDLSDKYRNDAKHFFSKNVARYGEFPLPGFSELAQSQNKVIDNTRIKSDEKFPDELTDEEIKNIYLECMGGLNGLIELVQGSLRNLLVYNQRDHLLRGINKEELTYRNEMTQVLIHEIPFLYQKLFEN